jgi:bifunctional DNA-binding transcriptional regulator/antitoxin component of YhaV-PrlF toxin-antitoxin module
MKTAPISSGGQVSIPAEVRRRWGASRVVIFDHGTSLELRPIPDDPIAAVRGSMAGPWPSTDEIRAMERENDAAIEARKWGR